MLHLSCNKTVQLSRRGHLPIMKNLATFSVASIPLLGIASQWIAWRLRVPSILLLLVVGFLAGPVFGILDPDPLFGEVLFPFVSLSVAIILFEGGLSLKIKDLKETSKIIRNLVTVGALVTWVTLSLAAYFLFKLDFRVSILLGSILVVTGPTVIIPLLKQIRVEKSLSSILKWEGIIIDPIGATLSVLIFETIFASSTTDVFSVAVLIILKTLLAGIFLGISGALILIFFLNRHWVPEYLQEALTLFVVMGVYVGSDFVQSESGLLAVTFLGIILANQNLIAIRHIVAFKENLTILLLSALFIILAARMDYDVILGILDWRFLVFIAIVIFISRPLTVFASTAKSSLTLNQKLFLSGIAPRGIVAAAVASIFSIRLEQKGLEEVSIIVPITFMVIVSTVAFYAMTGKLLASALAVQPKQKGILIAGANACARNLAKVLNTFGINTILVDTNIENIIASKEEGLRTISGSILSKRVIEEVEIDSLGTLITMTGSDEVNLLAIMEYSNMFGRNNVFRLYPQDRRKDLFTKQVQGLILYGKGLTFNYMMTRYTTGSRIKTKALTKEDRLETFLRENPKVIPFCMIQNNSVRYFSHERHPNHADNSILVYLG